MRLLRAHAERVALALTLVLLPSAGRGLVAQVAPPPLGRTSPATAVRVDTIDVLTRALDAEDRSDWPVALVAYREAIEQQLARAEPDGERLALAMLGVERVAAESGQLESLLPTIERVVGRRPGDPTVRAIQLRTLTTLARDNEARAAFDGWRRAANGDGAPYREYARLLLQQGRALAADSLLREASQRLGVGSALAGETAQLHVALQRWGAAASAFRDAFADQPWLETAALFALQRTPMAARDSVRDALAGPPSRLAPSRVLSSLELAWGEPRRAWMVLSAVPVDDSTVSAWRDFAERAEMSESWLVARDAWHAVFARIRTVDVQQRAAHAALRSGDATGALSLVRLNVRDATPAPTRGTTSATSRTDDRRALLAIEIEALGELGRVAEAQQRLDQLRTALDEETRRTLVRPLVGAWLRSGDVARAKAAVLGTELEFDDELMGWISLYEGNLALARKHLVRASTQRVELVDALGVLARVRQDTAVALGSAFLALARRDTAGAAAQFAQLAEGIGSAAPALLAMAARLSPPVPATALWDRVVRDYPKSPEAPEGLLASARLLRDRKDAAGAIARVERLLIDYPTSALAPQARRELDRLKGQVPPAGR